MDKSGDFRWLSGCMWLSGSICGEKWGKVRKIGEKRRKVGKSWKKWWKVVESGEKLLKVAKSRESGEK